MIEGHYGDARMSHRELDALIADARHPETRNLPGTLADTETNAVTSKRKSPGIPGLSPRAGDRGRTGDVQLGKLAFYR